MATTTARATHVVTKMPGGREPVGQAEDPVREHRGAVQACRRRRLRHSDALKEVSHMATIDVLRPPQCLPHRRGS